MNKLFTFLFLLPSAISFSQAGKIYLKNSPLKPGIENVYIYEPSKRVVIPDNAVVKVFYDLGSHNPVPLIKNRSKYEFSLKLPEASTSVMFIISDARKNTVDNNYDQGYVVYLKDKTKHELGKAKLNSLMMFEFANYAWELKISPDKVISEMEELYKQDPALKNEQRSYVSYLRLKYIKDNSTKPQVIKYAGQLEKNTAEKDLSTAIQLYDWLGMKDKAEQVKAAALKKYPKGELARSTFFEELYSNKNTTEQYLLDRLKAYQENFNDSSEQIKDRFYGLLVSYFLNKKDIANINKYENLLSDKIGLAGLYNSTAWQLSGETLTSPGTDLEFAEQISRRSVDIMKNRMNNPKSQEDPVNLQLQYIGYADTYALIMFKQKNYEAAFKFQDEIYRLDPFGMGTDGIERYAAFSEKVKGLEYTKQFIEEQLLAGQNSALMIKQLQDIYKKLNLPETEFDKIKQAFLALRNKKLNEELIAKYGSIKAIEFNLTNLEGKKVKLSDYRDKVIVLDFWATWCGPCRASFPHMQELVNEYKNKNVEFFFIDTWQQGTPVEIHKEVSKFIKENKYAFNVLLDYKNDIVTKYKIQGIPTKIVIDKKGNFLSVSSSADNLKALIDENL